MESVLVEEAQIHKISKVFGLKRMTKANNYKYNRIKVHSLKKIIINILHNNKTQQKQLIHNIFKEMILE